MEKTLLLPVAFDCASRNGLVRHRRFQPILQRILSPYSLRSLGAIQPICTRNMKSLRHAPILKILPPWNMSTNQNKCIFFRGIIRIPDVGAPKDTSSSKNQWNINAKTAKGGSLNALLNGQLEFPPKQLRCQCSFNQAEDYDLPSECNTVDMNQRDHSKELEDNLRLSCVQLDKKKAKSFKTRGGGQSCCKGACLAIMSIKRSFGALFQFTAY